MQSILEEWHFKLYDKNHDVAVRDCEPRIGSLQNAFSWPGGTGTAMPMPSPASALTVLEEGPDKWMDTNENVHNIHENTTKTCYAIYQRNKARKRKKKKTPRHAVAVLYCTSRCTRECLL
jgi:hypothetical protein